MHPGAACVKGRNREMHFCAQETFTDGACSEHVIKFRLFIPDDFLEILLTGGAAHDIHVEIASGAYGCTTVSFSLRDIIASLPYPAPEGLNSTHHIIPGEGS